MPDTPTFLSERLLSEGEKSIAFFLSLEPGHYEKVIYSEGSQWSVRQVLAHFVSAEHSLCRLVENIAAGGSGSPEDFDLDGYNERKVRELEDVSTADLVEVFRHNRQKTASIVAGLKPEDLQRQGRHPFLGLAPLSEIIKIIYRHNQIHIREIRQGF
jgi:hypothetical protein